MGLSMYLGEVDTQTESINSFCRSIIQNMNRVVQSIDAFSEDTILKGKTYDSAKIYFSKTYKVIACGMICLCEELIRQNECLTANFRAEVANSDVVEDEIREQIFYIKQLILDMNNLQTTVPTMNNMIEFYEETQRKLQEKVDKLYEFNQSSGGLYDNVIDLISSVSRGLDQLTNGKAWTTSQGVFNLAKLDMNWAENIENYWHDREINKEADELEVANESDKNTDWLSLSSFGASFIGFCTSNSKLAKIASENGIKIKTVVINGRARHLVLASDKALELLGVEFSRSKVKVQMSKYGGVPIFDYNKGRFTKYGNKLISKMPKLKAVDTSYKSVGEVINRGVKSGVKDIFSFGYKNLGTLEKVNKGAGQVGLGLSVVTNSIDALEDGFQATDVPRVAVDTAIDVGVGIIPIEIGGAIGTFFCPGIGTAIGVGIGFIIGTYLSLGDDTTISKSKKLIHKGLGW